MTGIQKKGSNREGGPLGTRSRLHRSARLRSWLRAGSSVGCSFALGCGQDDAPVAQAPGGTVSTGGAVAAGGSEASDAGGTSTAPAYVYDACDVTERVGGIAAVLKENHGYSSVTGSVGDAVDPVTLKAHDIGVLDVEGLKDGVTIEPIPIRFSYSNKGTLSHPAFDEGAPITLHVSGGEFPAFTLLAEGVAPLALPDDLEVLLEDGAPVELTWSAPKTPGRAHILLTLRISIHGADLARIECDQEDTGALTIPAELVSGLFRYGFAGFPAIDMVGQSVASVDLDVGCVDFRVGAERTRVPVTIPGLVSCNSGSGSEECPEGQTYRQGVMCGF